MRSLNASKQGLGKFILIACLALVPVASLAERPKNEVIPFKNSKCDAKEVVAGVAKKMGEAKRNGYSVSTTFQFLRLVGCMVTLTYQASRR